MTTIVNMETMTESSMSRLSEIARSEAQRVNPRRTKRSQCMVEVTRRSPFMGRSQWLDRTRLGHTRRRKKTLHEVVRMTEAVKDRAAKLSVGRVEIVLLGICWLTNWKKTQVSSMK